MKKMQTMIMILVSVLFCALILAACGSDTDSEEKKSDRSSKKKSSSKKTYEVGEDIEAEDITDFYYTYGSIEFDVEYQRYRFYEEDGKHFFFHDLREAEDGEPGSITDDDIISSGTAELTDDEWEEFFDLISGGTVKKREESTDTGDSGPWMFLYWEDDKDEYQEYAFADYGAQKEFVAYCESMTGVSPDAPKAENDTDALKLQMFTYSPGYSDMNGAFYDGRLVYDKGAWTYVYVYREYFGSPTITTTYRVAPEDAEEFAAFLNERDVLALVDREDSDVFVTDYSPWHIGIWVDESATGGDDYEHYSLDEYKAYSQEDRELIKELISRFEDLPGEVLSEEIEGDDSEEDETDTAAYERTDKNADAKPDEKAEEDPKQDKRAPEPFELKKEWLMDQTYVLVDPAPQDLQELKKAVDVYDPRSVAAYWVWAVNRLTEDYDDGMAMMKYLFADIEPYGRGYTEGGVSGKAGWDSYFDERLGDDSYSWLPRAYFEGSSTRTDRFALESPLTANLHYNAPNTETLNDQSLDALGRLNIVYWVESRAAGNKVNITLSRFEGTDRWYVTSGTSSTALFYMQ